MAQKQNNAPDHDCPYLGIVLTADEEATAETLEELTDGKGDDDDE